MSSLLPSSPHPTVAVSSTHENQYQEHIQTTIETAILAPMDSEVMWLVHNLGHEHTAHLEAF